MPSAAQEEKVTMRVGSRKSQLALIQTEHVISQLQAVHPHIEFQVVKMSTLGDNVLDKALSKIGEKSLFTKELEVALERGEVDFVVHSLKDLPTSLPPGMVIGAILEREDPRDAVILKEGLGVGEGLESLPEGSVLGTSSLRRSAQLRSNFPHLQFQDVRGNLNTRLAKLDSPTGPYSALVLAVAGVSRLALQGRISQHLPPHLCMHAVGQGALAVECREGDTKSLELLGQLSHRATVLAVMSERGLMRRLEGGCSVPVAASSSLEGDTLKLTGGVWSLCGGDSVSGDKEVMLKDGDLEDDGVPEKRKKTDPGVVAGVYSGDIPVEELKEADNLGVKLAEDLIEKGASAILTKARENIAAPINQPPSQQSVTN